MDLKEFFKSYLDDSGIKNKGFTWSRLGGDGSNRIFYRLSNNQHSIIVMDNPPVEENAEKENMSYLKIGKHLLNRGIPVPFIYKHDLERGWFIMEDLGDNNLQQAALTPSNLIGIYKKVVELLVEMQLEGRGGFDSDWCYQTKRYDGFTMKKFESDYFSTYFLRGMLELKQDLSELKSSFKHLVQRASIADSDFFLHRDFQSRNLIIKDDKIRIIDWQGGRLGPLQYDLASLLIDPYVGLKNNHREILYDYYLKFIEGRIPGISDSFTRYYPYLAVQRNLQILGAFSYLGKIQGKKGFLSYIPPALQSLDGLLDGLDETELYPLKRLVGKARNLFKV
jgi:aminoglycoside/choline kinase family phosphotransferase